MRFTRVRLRCTIGEYCKVLTTGVDDFLGCAHHTQKFITKDGREGQAMIYEMHKFMKSCLERYLEVARKHMGADYEIPFFDSPFVDEDCLPNPARRPQYNADGPTTGCVCPILHRSLCR